MRGINTNRRRKGKNLSDFAKFGPSKIPTSEQKFMILSDLSFFDAVAVELQITKNKRLSRKPTAIKRGGGNMKVSLGKLLKTRGAKCPFFELNRS